MAPPAIQYHHLLWYLEKYLSLKGSMEQTAEAWDSQHHLPWNRDTCLFVLTYVVQFCSNVDHSEFSPVIMALDQIAKCVHESYIKQHSDDDNDYDDNNDDDDDDDVDNGCGGDEEISKKTQNQEDYLDEIEKKQQEFSQLLVNTFFPDVVPRFFMVPKIEQLPDKDKHLKPNEILAGFLDFILQVLHREANIGEGEGRHVIEPVQKQLSFLLAVLGDTPFHFSHHDLAEEVGNLLVEFEILANEAGILVYDCVFHIHLVEGSSRFNSSANAFLEKVELLNPKIKEHCIKFTHLPVSVISRFVGFGVIESFFIIHSLFVDIENLMDQRITITHADDSIKDDIVALHGELTILQTFVKVSQVPNEQKEALIQIRDLAYEIEYLISSHIVGNMDVWYLNLRLPSMVQKIKLARMGLQQNSEMHGSNFDNEVSFRRMEDPASMDNNYFVDFNSDITEKILEDLIGEGENTVKVISILGVPGSGKTITATKLYNCSEVSAHFDLRAWYVFSETYSVRNMFIQILMGIESNQTDKNAISKKNDEELCRAILESLNVKRYLIVLDDVCDANLLFGVLGCFPSNQNGSRILITSQSKDFGGMHIIPHELPFLSDDECWDLLMKKVFRNDQCPPELLGIGKSIATRCSGIPLAVVNIADILVSLEKERSLWETVEEQLDAFLLDGESNYRKRLELSYERLPHYLKPCFLYFATFPKDAEISKDQLAWMWIAGGYIQKNEQTSQEDTANMYISDMVNRGLVPAAKMDPFSRVKTFRIHDMWHRFCVRKANEENFIKSSKNFAMYEKHHHLCIPPASGLTLRPFGHNCRSLRGCPTDQSLSFQSMPLLKVMDLYSEENSYLLSPHFDLPLQLKYLGVSDLGNGMVDNLVSVEFIHVRSNDGLIVVPSVILRMAMLRHIALQPTAQFEEDCSVSETSDLNSLSFVYIYRENDEEILRHLPHLHKLKCISGGDAMIFPDISFNTELKSLKICFVEISSWDIPNFSFPSTLKKLSLSGAVLTGEHMSIIGGLPNLQVLKLKDHGFDGNEWEVKDDEFEKLRILKIESTGLRKWKSGRASYDDYSFPRLERLVLRGCSQLEEIPFALVYVRSLERFEVMECEIEAYLSAFEILEFRKKKVQVVMDKTMEQLKWQVIEGQSI